MCKPILIHWTEVAVFIFSVLVVIQGTHAVYAQTSSRVIIKPESNAFVNTSYYTYNKNMEQGSPPSMLKAGHVPGSVTISYARFDLPPTKIPRSDPFTDISIDSAVLTALINGSSRPGYYVVTVSSCNNNSWSEKLVTAETRPCPGLAGVSPLDAFVVRGADLPVYGSWTVTEGVSNAVNNTRQDVFTAISAILYNLFHPTTSVQHKITFKIPAVRLPLGSFGYVVLFSKDAENAYFGPPIKLLVTYTTAPSNLKNVLDILVAIVLPVGAILWGVVHWIYRKRKQQERPTTTK